MPRKLFIVYALSLLAGILLLHTDNLLILNGTLHELFPFTLPATIIGSAAVAILLTFISIWRLQPAFILLGSSAAESDTRRALSRLFYLPYEISGGIIVLGFLFSILYNAFIIPGDRYAMSTHNSAMWANVLANMTGGISLSITISIFIFISLRWLLRPVISQLQPWPGSFAGRTSIVHPLLITYGGTFLVAMLNLFQLALVAAADGESIDPYKFGGTALLYFLMGFILFCYITIQFRSELHVLIRNIRGLVGGRKQLSGKMPVVSHDEAGELAVAFNELQLRIDREYESLERELKLAYNVQQKLLPQGDLKIGSYRITARCQPYREVGGDFYDVVSLNPGRFAVMIGDVSGKGMPAALLMSALLLLFRAEIRRNASPSEVMARMNRQLCEAMGEEGSVSIGVGVIDMTTDTIQYASAGHLSPYIVSADGSFRIVDCSSLPMGFDPEAAYEEVNLQLEPCDRFVLYTDGLIEAVDPSGNMYSFEGLEAELKTWRPDMDLSSLVDEWLARIDKQRGPGSDDRTVVILDLAGKYRSALSQLDFPEKDRTEAAQFLQNQFMSREWSIPSTLGGERAIAEEIGAWIEESWPETNIREDVQSAMAEAIINAVEHGNELRQSTYVAVLAQIGSRLAVCKVYDEGGGYFPSTSKEEEEMAKRRESDDPRGWGLLIIDSLADYWATGRDERGFYTELYFLRKTKPAYEQ